MSTGSFRFLMKHELRMELRNSVRRIWIWTYLLIAFVLAAVALTIWGGEDQFNPSFLLFPTYMFPFIMFMFGLKALKREWVDGTYGWWMTLPYSRSRLLAAKGVAAWLQVMGGFVLYLVVVLLLGIYTFTVHGEGWSPVKQLLFSELQYGGIIAGVSPMMITLGLLAAAVRRSSMRPLALLIWFIGFGICGNAVSWVSSYSSFSYSEDAIGVISVGFPGWVWLLIAPVWIIAFALFTLVAKICNKYLQV